MAWAACALSVAPTSACHRGLHLSQILTLEEAADELHSTPETVSEWIRTRGLPAAKPGRCAAQVWIKDVYRRTGRTKSGFEMHYNRQQCSRKATHGKYCRQHNVE